MRTVYFDSTFGHPWVTSLSHLFMMRKVQQPHLKHIFQISTEGEEDSRWTQTLANEGDCIVVTGDQGRRGKDKPRLPQVCKNKNLTHILLSPNVHSASKFERARAIIVLWPQILQTFDSPPGSRYQIKQNIRRNSYILEFKE